MATPNPVLQQILKDISGRANQGRLNINWGVVTESRKRKVSEAATVPAPDEEKPDEPSDLPDLPKDDTAPKAKASAAPAPNAPPPTDQPTDEKPAAPDVEASAEDGGEDVDSAKEDAEKAKAELEKAKAEKDQAEQELEQNSYIKLNTPSGISFLLGKLLDKAFKTNTIDSLASDFVNKLKITNPDDFSTFSSDMVPYKNLVGMAEFLQSVKALSANAKQPTNDGEE